MMWSEIWDMDSRNAVGDFATVQLALTAVRAHIQAHGRGAAQRWVLAVTDGDDTQQIADGEGLITLALGTPASGAAVPA